MDMDMEEVKSCIFIEQSLGLGLESEIGKFDDIIVATSVLQIAGIYK